jgi:sensor domain CHASE-containing protein
MSLRLKVLLTVLFVLTLSTLLDLGILHLVVLRSFVTLERTAAQRDLARCAQAITREIKHLDTLAQDWAAWDDTYTYVQDHNRDYEAANLLWETFVSARLNLLYIVDSAGQVVWGRSYDLETQEELHLRDFPDGTWPATHPLLVVRPAQATPAAADAAETTPGAPSPGQPLAGPLVTEHGILLTVARPILTSVEEGPARGTLIMGRFLDQNALATLRKQVNVEFVAWSIPAADDLPTAPDAVPADQRDLLPLFSPQQPFVMREQSADLLQIYTVMPGILGQPVLLLRADIPREITAIGQIVLRYSLISILIVGVAVVIILSVFLRQVVTDPIDKLTAHVLAIGKTGDLSARLALRRSDEIGMLATGFDGMVAQLAEARRRLLEQSYYSGMAEMAVGTLHNLGNALSPLVVRHDNLRRMIGEAPLDNLERASAELADENTPAERRARLNRYVPAATARLIGLCRELEQGLAVTGQQMAQIESILAEQERFSRSERVLEPVKLAAALDDALSLVRDELRQAIDLVVAAEVGAACPVLVQRTMLLQVLGNLLANAAESIGRAGRPRGIVQVGAELETAAGRPMLHIRLADDGAGIAAGDLERIFQRGFTTKERGHGGLGLHWCANVVAGMQGRLYAESPGPGQGACFHLILPCSEGNGERS